MVGINYHQEDYKGEAEDIAKTIHLNEKVTLENGNFDEVEGDEALSL